MITDSAVEVAGVNGRREININNFFKGYKQIDVQDDEIITGITLPLPAKNEIMRFYKISKRKHLDISTFSAAFKIKVNNNIVENFSVAMGGVAACPVRLFNIEKALKGGTYSENLFAEAGKLIDETIFPLSDLRGSKEYRLNLAKNILLKFYQESNKTITGEICQQ